MQPRIRDIPEIKRSQHICSTINLKTELNRGKLLIDLCKDLKTETGLANGQYLTIDILAYKGGSVLLRYAEDGKIDTEKAIKLINQEGRDKAIEILGSAALGLLEEWGFFRGGLSITFSKDITLT